MKLLLMSLAVLVAGCSSGLKEVAFMDQGRYIVNRSLANDRFSVNQPHGAGLFSCRQKISSEDMAELRKDGNVHSAYMNCEPAEHYTLTSDPSQASLAKGPAEAVILGAAIGTGLAVSGDTISQRSGLSSSTSVSVKQKSVTKGGKRR